jgi:hypothetical protein
MYRDSKLGLCIDLSGPEGNVFHLLGIGNDIAAQIGRLDEWKSAVRAVKLMDGNYATIVNLFEEFFPVITLVNKEICIGENEEALEQD